MLFCYLLNFFSKRKFRESYAAEHQYNGKGNYQLINEVIDGKARQDCSKRNTSHIRHVLITDT